MRMPNGSAIFRTASALSVLMVLLGFSGVQNASGQGAAISSSCLVMTTGGLVHGQDLGESCAFLGIPYAAPPIGNLRWKPPEPKAPWAPATLDVITPPSTCTASEDCLKLNIWAPKQLLLDPAPVLLWFHTGGFAAASANFAANNGEKLAEQTGTMRSSALRSTTRSFTSGNDPTRNGSTVIVAPSRNFLM